MTDRPILFSAPMVQALLDGRKTQTRRVLKRQPECPCSHPLGFFGVTSCFVFDQSPCGSEYGQAHIQIPIAIGDRLWVRETFGISGITWGRKPSEAMGGCVHYMADTDHGWQSYWGKTHPSIHMPRWASRLTLTVTDVRVQRLQEISENDVRAEGTLIPAYPGDENHATRELINCYGPDCPVDEARSCNFHGCWGIRENFKDLWNSINGPDAWGANPWVAAYTFTVHQQNIDQMDTAA